VVTKVDDAVEVQVVGAIGPQSHYLVLNTIKSPIAVVGDVGGFKITGDYAIFNRFTKAEVDKHNEEDEGDDQEVQQEVEEVQQEVEEVQQEVEEVQQEVEEVQQDEEHQEQEQKSRAKGTWNVQQSKATSKPQQRRESKAREKHTKRRDSKTEAKIKRERGREKEKKEQEEAEVTELGELREPIVKQET
jgi:chromosome segregation ATPase